MYRRSKLMGSSAHLRFGNRLAPKVAHPKSPSLGDQELAELARSQHIELSYRDMDGRITRTPRPTLLAILQMMGLSVSNERSIRKALREVRLRRWREPIEPVLLAWDGAPAGIQLRFPGGTQPERYARLHLEDGSVKAVDLDSTQVHSQKRTSIEGETFCIWDFKLPPLPCGYHQVELNIRGRIHRSLIIAAPTEAYSPPNAPKNWGVFLPMYAARSRRGWGAGDLTDWRFMTQWAGELGANVVATLPLLAGFLDRPIYDPSPYAPVSRLFWNEFYLDLGRVPGFNRPIVQKLIDSRRIRKRIEQFRSSDSVQYRAGMLLKREVLETLTRLFFSEQSVLRTEFESFLKENPAVVDYAEFRATCERTQKPWHIWEERLRRGKLQAGDYSLGTKRYYLFTQWLAQRQFRDFADFCRERQMKFHLDLPLGVHPDGYDAWRQHDSFAFPASVGAPPDLFFSEGQNWGFAPLHPRQLRQTHYAYVLAYLRFQMRHCQLLRIDHVMGLHRLFWIPPGFTPRQGAYVAYPAEELYAVLNLESHRHRTIVIGENLGTVPPEVNRAMVRHGIRQTYVLQFAQRADPKRAIAKPPRCSVATLNTHDMPPFAAHWRGRDVIERADMGLLSRPAIKKELALRQAKNSALIAFLKRHKQLTGSDPSVHEVIKASLQWLAQGQAETVINQPGRSLAGRTPSEYPRHRRPAQLATEGATDARADP